MQLLLQNLRYGARMLMKKLGLALIVVLTLGAERSDVLRFVLGQGMKPTLLGVGIGLLAAFALASRMGSLLFAVRPTDPWTYGVMAMLMLSVALLACWRPSRQATKVDPIGLRYE